MRRSRRHRPHRPHPTPARSPMIPRGQMEAVMDLARGMDCLLCRQGPAYTVAVWTPTDSVQRRLMVPEGRYRIVFYPLCRICTERGQASVEEAERVILRQAALATAHLVN